MKHFISSLSVINANTPPCEGRVSSRKILSLLLILFLSIGNVWAESIEINTSNSGVNGSYRDYTFDVNSVTFGCTQWMKNNNIQAKKSITNSLYNVDAIPGTITSIVVKQTGTARAIKIYGGTASKPTTQITSPSAAAEMTFDFTGKDYTYFSLTTPGNACYFDKITINYTPSSSGGDPEPDPEPEPDPTPEPGGEVASYTWDLTKASYSASNTSQVTWSATDVNMVLTKESSSTNANNYLGGTNTHTRVYKDQKITFTPAANVTITSIEIVSTTADYASKFASSTWNNATAEASGSTVTITPSNGSNAIICTIGAATRATGVTVNYTKAASGEPEPVIVKTLKSIEVTGMTTTFEQGDIFKFNGTCTATYSVTKDGVAQADETAEVTPTSVSTPNMNTIGTQAVTVTYETVSTTYDITITENEVTAGAYNVLLNNELWNVTAGQQVASVESMTGKSNDITFYTTKGSSQMYASATQTRFYNGATFVISVPNGYVIKSIVFAEPTSDKKWEGSIRASVGTYDDGTKSWSGNAQEVIFSFDAQNRIKSVKVTYAADVKYALNITTPSNGTLVVKDGSTVLADDAQVYEGTKLVVTPTPATGYVFESLTVNGSAVELTDGSYTLTMPAADVTIAATFKANEKPAATLTLSKNGNSEDITGYKQDDKVVLPSITSDCVKAFVGWSADDECATEPEYKADEEYTLTETAQTLYAVYATVGGGGETTAANTLSSNGWANESKHTSLQIDANVKATVAGKDNSGKYYNSGTDWRLYQSENATITISTTVGELKSVKFTFTNSSDGTLLYGSTKLTSGDAVEVSGTSATFSVSDTNEDENKGQIRFTAIEVVYTGGVSYSNYSTTCAAAPKAEVNPTTISATAAGANGKVTVTYDNVKTENVAVALYNDAACTDAFTADWLTASLDGDKNIAYTVAATTLYTERKAYIQLTAPETTGAIDPAVVVIPVTQAGKDKVFASLEELLANITPTEAPTKVTVTLTKEPIVEIYVSGTYRNGIYLNVPYQGENKKIEIYCWNVPATWVLGGSVSGTLTNCDWKDYNGTWELCPADWSELTYTAPATVSSIAVSGTPTTTTYVDGEKFDPAGLVVTATYSDATTEVVTTYANWTIDPATLTKGQTSVNVTATYNSISSAAYEVTGLTVNDIPTKTVAEFIASEGGRCYLEGIVSNITNTTYGNFDLTDASGKIYVYGCLNAAGESQKFADLGVKNGDKIKVIADEYELYDDTKDEAINVQYVSHVSAATITIADITMEVGETKTIAATVVPAEATVTYTIKENAANAISLSGNTITALAEGTATITATVAEGATYLGNSVDFKVTVTPKSEKTNVVILAEYNGEWYAMTNACTDNKQMGALKVTYVNGVILDFVGDKASITWERAVVGNKATFKNNGKYLVGGASPTLNYTSNTFEWDVVESKYLSDANTRTFLFQGSYFKNYAISNAGKTTNGTTYSAMPVVTAVEFMNSVATPSVEKGIFSVADGKFVQFSTGNLQYNVGTNTWSFASEQYEVIGGKAYTGSNNTNYGMNVPGYTGKLDLFAWSCDGKFGVNPSNADADYTGTFADWGSLVSETGWYTLTKDEMSYLLNRKKDGKKLWAFATINDLVGLILLPDNWKTSITLEYGYVPEQFVYTKNLLSIAEWQTLEENGAVFLPAAGSRTGGYGNKESAGGSGTFNADGDYFHVDNVNIYGYYWLNTQDTRPAYPHCASYLILPGWSEGPTVDAEGVDDLSTPPAIWSREKRRGNSVRLVKKVTPNYTREVRPEYYGTICLENGGQMIGASLFELSYYNEAQGLLYMDEAYATMVAGNPYVFLPNERATNKTLYVFYTDEANAAAKTVNGLVGYLGDENMQLEGNGTNYILQDNKIKKVVGGNNSNVFVTKNRAYIQLGSVGKNEPAPVPGRRRVAIGQAPQVATGMENVDASAQPVKMIIDGQLYILRGEKMYDAQGKLVK